MDLSTACFVGVLVIVIILIMRCGCGSSTDGFAARRPAQQNFAARRKDTQRFAARRPSINGGDKHQSFTVGGMYGYPTTREGMCGGFDQMCPCAGNETMSGKPDPHEVTPDMLSKVSMGY